MTLNILHNVLGSKTDLFSPEQRPSLHSEDILLSALYIFYINNRNEVSLGELCDCMQNFQQEFPQLGYSFSEKIRYSLELDNDLERLQGSSWIKKCKYNDNLLPAKFIKLTSLGEKYGKKAKSGLTEEGINFLTSCVKEAVNDHIYRYKIWGREIK